MTLGADGAYGVGFATQAQSIDYGEYAVADGTLDFLTAHVDCQTTPEGSYMVNVNREGETVTGLRFKVIDDSCETRKGALGNATLPPVQ